MKQNESVDHIMTPDPVSINRNGKPSEVRRILEERSIHHLPVTDGNRLVGIISATDLLRVTFEKPGTGGKSDLDAMLDQSFTVADLMNREPVTVSSRSSIREAAQILVSGKFHSLPIVDGDQLIGIVTSSDLIRYLLDQY
jgi:CBS domain-containing protein